MSRLTGWVGVAIAMIIVKSSDPVAASLVDAGDITSVYASAPYFDTRLEDENGCDPAGCVAGLTRDGDSSTPTSRWSCTPALGPVGTICSIVYDLDAPLNLQQLRVGTGMSPDLALKEHGGFSMIKGRVDSTVGLSADTPNTLRACSEEYVGRVRFVADRLYPHVDIPHSLLALYEGDMRQRTLEVYVEGVLATNWTSSGTTTDFETIELPGTPAQMVELRGVLSRSEWLSITEVEIMAYDGTTVEVGTLATVETSATYFDTRVSDENGCDPEGCEPSKTRDDDLSDNSRWSCSPQLGGDCIITYDLGAVYDLSELMLAFYRGTERTRTLDIIVDGTLVTTWTSSGTTDGFQRIDVSGQSGQVIELLGDLPDGNSWLSITETRIMVVHDGMPPSPTPSNPTTPSPVAPGAVPVTRTTSDGRLIVEAGELDWVVLSPQSTNLHDSSLAAEGGCDPIGCVKEYTRDGSLDANSRWSCQFTPSSSSAFDMARYQCRIFYDLRDMREIYAVRVAFHLGDERTRTLEVWVDDVQYVPEWTSSGATADFETIPMPSSGIIGQDITIRANLDVDEWISITEVEIDVVVDDVPLLGVSASDRTTVTATASAGDPDLLLDGVTDDSASSWACSGEDCSVTFDVQDVEELVQISMAFVEDGNIASNIFDVSVAIEETGPFTKVLTDIPSNKDRPLTPQQFKITELARIIRIEPSTLGSGSLDITEVDIRVGEEVPIRGVAVDTSLQAVGLLPLAEGSRGDERTEEEGGCGTQGCRLFNLKDGDMSTFWRCYGSPEDPTSTYITYDCRVDIDFHYFRHLKQIRIALPDGAERATQMRFTARRAALVGADHVQESVMSSGLTDGFETYDFDVLTQTLEVQAVFNGALQSISIAELEFLEEPWMDGQIPVTRLGVPYSSGRVYPEELLYENGFAWGDDENVIGSSITFNLAFYATVSAISLKFPVGTRYKFDLVVYDVEEVYEDGIRLEGLESADEEDFQVFSLDFVPAGIVVDSVSIVMQGTVDGDDAFVLLDGRVYGTIVDNPTNMYTVGSTATDYWTLIDKYPDFVAEGSSDQNTIMEAICTVKKATFDGVNCVGGDPDATGEVELAMGDYYLDGPVYMQSGVFLKGRYTDDDAPYITEFNVQDGSAGISEEAAVLVFNGIENASTRDIWIRGQYDPDTDNSVSAVSGFGSKCLEIVNCKNVTAGDADVRNCDGDAVTVVNSQMVNIDAGRFDDEFLPWSISNSRGIGLLIENSDSVWIRRHTLYNNGEAGLVIRDTRNVTFEATFNYEYSLGEGNVGSLDGQQPIEVVIEGTSTMITFDHMRVTSTNEPAITVGPDSTNVKFVECVFSAIDSGACVIEAANPSVVDITDSDEVLTLQDQCFVKV